MMNRCLVCWLALVSFVVLGFGCNAEWSKLVSAALVEGEDTKSTEAASQAKTEKHPANRLARETSPYLLLHAHNPVDWHPWGPEAFEKARKENKPIFLSIGYSSCFWCHVMERKVFMNETLAKYMNEHFICIKVDREERPEIDDIYMTALMIYLQAAGSSEGGGWPLSMFLTSEGKPIAGGTYFPPETENGRLGFGEVMKIIDKAWTNDKKAVEENAEMFAREVERNMKPRFAVENIPLDRALVEAAATAIRESADADYGGVDFDIENPDTAKFPVPVKLGFLQYDIRRNGNKDTEQILDLTLEHIARGGIRDHLGGGFHRYSTDRQWLVPHFEKMLYDQAQLADLYLEAFRRTNNPEYRTAAEETLNFVLRDLRDQGGAFYSALDAETDGVEGQFYVWDKAEIEKILGPDPAEFFGSAYGLEEPKHFEHGYVLHRPASWEQIAEDQKTSVTELQMRLSPLKAQLLEARSQRKPLLKDDKILTSWNGLMIRTLAEAGQDLGQAQYQKAAEEAAIFILANMRDDKGHLQRTHRAGQSKLNAYLDDYAFLIEGLLAIHEATKDQKWLNASERLMDDQIELFWDETGDGFFFTAHHHEELIARIKQADDTVIPSGNSVSVRNLVRLASLTGEDKYRVLAEKTLKVFASPLKQRPRGMANMALALGEFLDNPNFAAARTQVPAEQNSPKPENPILQAAAESPAPEEGKKPEIVTAKAYLNVDKFPPGGTCEIVVFLDIEEGWHINANPAQPENLIPTKFTIASNTGITLDKVAYPKGKPFQIEGFDEPALVYEKQAVVRGRLTIPADVGGAASDSLEISIRYQPCNDKQCLAPKTAKLTGKVPIARKGQAVKFINQNLFPKPAASNSP
jgi:uncharacterized protein YyaL (SSP411 family)